MKNMEVPEAIGEVEYKEYDIWADICFCEQCRMNRPSHLSQFIVRILYFTSDGICIFPLILSSKDYFKAKKELKLYKGV